VRSRFAIASWPKTRGRAFGLALIALSSIALAPRAEAHWQKSHLPAEIASASAFTQIVEERVGGAVTKSYVFGPQRSSMRDATGLHHYGYDAHSGVRALLDASGAVTDTYEYDAFGNLLARTGTTANEFTYQGERFDSTLAMYPLEERAINPSTGRFSSMGTFSGLVYEPLTLNKYSYVRGDPVNRTDPTGNCDCFAVSVAAAGSVSTVLNTLALGATTIGRAYIAAKLEPPGKMRAQVQRGTTQGRKGETYGVAVTGLPGIGVSVTQAIAALWEAWATAPLPRRAKESAKDAVKVTSATIAPLPLTGAVSGRFNFKGYFDYSGYPDARVELENLQGHNRRSP